MQPPQQAKFACNDVSLRLYQHIHDHLTRPEGWERFYLSVGLVEARPGRLKRFYIESFSGEEAKPPGRWKRFSIDAQF